MGIVAKNDEKIMELLRSGKVKVAQDGSLWSLRSRQGHLTGEWRRLKTTNRGDGYLTYTFKSKRLQVHRIVYAALKGDLEPTLVINHIDGNPSNNHPSNLELITHAENVRHGFRVLGNKPVIGYSKINQSIADSIRADHAAGLGGYGSLAKKYGVSKTTVAYVVTGRIWKKSLPNR